MNFLIFFDKMFNNLKHTKTSRSFLKKNKISLIKSPLRYKEFREDFELLFYGFSIKYTFFFKKKSIFDLV